MHVFKRTEDGDSGQQEQPAYLNLRSSKGFILTVISTAIFTDIFLYGVIVPVIPFALQTRVGVPHENVQHWVSVMLAIYAAGLLVFSPIWGWCADYMTLRGPSFLMGLLALIGATALLCVGNTIPILIAGRLLQGISAALVWTVGLAIVSDTVGNENLGEAMGWVTMGMGIAIFLAPMLGGIVFSYGGYYAVFGMAFGLVGLDIVMRLVMIETKVAKKYLAEPTFQTSEPKATGECAGVDPGIPLHRPKRVLPALFTLLREIRLLSGLFGCMAVSILLTSFDSVLPLYVNHIFGWNSTGAGLIFLSICLPSFLEPLIGRLGDRFGHRWLVVSGFAMGLPFFVLLRLVYYDSIGQKVLLCALLFLIGFCLSFIMPALLAEMTMIVTDRELRDPGVFGNKSAFAQAYALFNMAYALGALVGPIWAGYVNQTAGWGTMSWTFGLLSAVTAVPAAIWTGGSLFKRKEKSAAAAQQARAERQPISEGYCDPEAGTS